jgi:CheY-like chemotaxis protein
VGAGLGLSLCHTIIDSLDGEITVESAPGEGSLFRVVLPGIEGAAPSSAQPIVVPTETEPRGRLLFIDDEGDICEAMEEAMAPFHTLVSTTGASEALKLLAAGQCFDAILCDMRMPDMTGIEFHTRLQIENPTHAARVVLMSGGFTRRPGDPPIVLPRPLLEKPFAIQKVLSLMREAMKRTPSDPARPEPVSLALPCASSPSTRARRA